MRHDSLFKHSSGATESTFMLKTGITSPITCLTMLPNKICIGSHDGIFFYDRSSGKETHVLRGIDIYRIFESSQKELWIGTRMYGLYRINKKEKSGKCLSAPVPPQESAAGKFVILWKTANGTSGLEHLTDYINIVRKQDSIPLSKSPNT